MTTVNFRHVTDESGALPMNDNDPSKTTSYDGMWQSNFIAKARIASRAASTRMAIQIA